MTEPEPSFYVADREGPSSYLVRVSRQLAARADLTRYEMDCLEAGDKAPGEASEAQRGAYRRALRKLAEVA